MWKPLSIVSGLLLIGAGGLMYAVVKPEFKSELLQLEASKTNLGLAKANQKDSSEKNSTSKSDLTKSKELLGANIIKKEGAAKLKQKAVKETEDANAEKEKEEKALAELKKTLDGLGGLQTVVAQLKTLKAKKAQLEADKEKTQAATDAYVAHKAATDQVITALKTRELFQQTGTVKAGATTRVVEASPELGFFVLGSGNASNITKNSKWDVVRDNTVIARLVVTHIQQNRSIAELVPGTLAAGNQVMPGDRVVVNSASTPAALSANITNSTKAGAGKKDAAKPAAPGGETPAPNPLDSPGTPAEKMEPAPAPPTGDTPAPEAPKEEKPATP